MLSSSRPYPCRITSRADGLDYEFTTAQGTEFIVYFLDEHDFFEGSPFAEATVSIGFRAKGGRVTQRGFRVPTVNDPQLFATIAWAIDSFLAQHQHTFIIWVCSTSDNQEAARQALFDRQYRRWQQHSPLTLHKHNLELAPREYMSIVYRDDNRFRAELEMLLPES